MTITPQKPLGRKAYGHIPHLPGSRMIPADHQIHTGQAKIATEAPRDKFDSITITEKLDGSCVSIARIEGILVPLIRTGYKASDSFYEQHHIFDVWARDVFVRLDNLNEGERIVGEWLAQAHGTRYNLPHEPFVVFDVFREKKRISREEMIDRFGQKFITPSLISAFGPKSIEEVLNYLDNTGSQHGATDPVEGAVWRVERNGEVDFLAKYVRPEKEDGIYLPEQNGGEDYWNWRPN